MNVISAALKAHYAQESTTLCRLLKITRQDGAIYGFNSSPSDITYGGLIYLSTVGFDDTAVATTAALNVDNLEANFFIDGVIITEAEVLAGKWDLSAFLIVEINYRDTSMGHRHIKSGTIGTISTGRNTFKLELLGLTQRLQQNIGRLVMSECDATLGDARCGVDLAPFTFSASITAVTSGRVFTASDFTQAVDYFTAGKATFASGANIGVSMEIKYFAAGVIELQQSMVGQILVGDTVTVIAGCNKQRPTCVTKFNNILNYRGFPDLPGSDALMSGA